jgi:hypothetical protein
VESVCEQCGEGAALCVSDWGYIAALCDECLKDRSNYLKLPRADSRDAGQASAVSSSGANR